MITKRDRVYALLKGEILDKVPTGFWMHFPEKNFFGENAVNAHLEYFDKSKTDMCKVMTEHIYPCSHNIEKASDWGEINIFDEDTDFIRKQAEIIRAVVKEAPDVSIMGTVHGVIASASHTLLGIPRYDGIGSHAIIYHSRVNPEIMAKAFGRISDTLCAMVRAQIKAGAEGIYYAALGGESYLFSDEEHAEIVAPYDKKVIEAAYEAGAKYVVLHICKPKVKLERFSSYKCNIVNWGIEESGVSLEEGRKLFPGKILLGGFNARYGSLISGTNEDIERETADLLYRIGTNSFVLGADCTLPGSLPYDRIAAVADASSRICLKQNG